MTKQFRYTEEHIQYLREITPFNKSKTIVELFNTRFGLNKSKRQIDNCRWNNNIKLSNKHKLSSFKKGHTSYNKGTKGLVKSNSGSFKSGKDNSRYKPVGSEGLNRDYISIKVAEPDKWIGKHIYLWEKENGEIPKNHRVIFADNNKRNFKMNNLLLVSMGQLNRLSINKLRQNDTELTKTMLQVVKIYEAIDERKKDI